MKIAIVGAGVMGSLMAFELSQSHHTVVMYDDGRKANCSMAAAGLLSPTVELEKHDLLIYELGKRAFDEYLPNIIAKLNSSIYFRRNGSLVLSHPRDDAELQQFFQRIQCKIDVKNIAKFISSHDINMIEPELNKFNHGIYFSSEGQIDNQFFLQEIANYLREKITWHDATFIDEFKQNFDLVIDCRGLFAKDFLHNLRGVRGEIIWLYAPQVNINHPIRILHPRYSLYVVPRQNQIYLIGASEIESEDNSEISVRTTLELLTAAYSLHPGFAEARIIKTATQLRPAFSDHLPKIIYEDGFIAINGLYRHGFLIAPTLANEVNRWIKNGINAVEFPEIWEVPYDKNCFQSA